MTIGIYTSEQYFQLKKDSIEEAVKKLGIEVVIASGDTFRPSLPTQTFGFEEMFKRAQAGAKEAITRNNADIGIGIEDSLSLMYNVNEWYYVIGISVETSDGQHAESFTPGVRIPSWMMKEIQDDKIEIDSLTSSLAGEDDPITYFSGGTLTRKDIMIPAVLLALVNLNLQKGPAAGQ
jgi:non-canonical (house-cleaning) NTP pyrophosphatase